MSLSVEQEARGYLLTMVMIENLDLNEVKRWYNIDPEAEVRRP